MSKEIQLDIDYRERGIIELIEGKDDDVKVCNLVIGDFLIKEGDTIQYVIERKTVLDLASSIVDGRFREQKQRILESIQDSSKVIYIIEGRRNKEKYGGISKKIIDSAIINLTLVHKYNVICTEDEKDTLTQVLSICDKLKDNKFGTIQTGPVKLKKKSTSLVENVFVNMLSMIPGVSLNIAKKIEEEYKSMNELMIGYINDSTLKEKLLSNIQVTPKKKIGDVLSKKIYAALFECKVKVQEEETCLI